MPPVRGGKQIRIDGHFGIPVCVQQCFRFLCQLRPGEIQRSKYQHPQRVAFFHPDVFLMFPEIVYVFLRTHAEQSFHQFIPMDYTGTLSAHMGRPRRLLCRGREWFLRLQRFLRHWFRSVLIGKELAAPPLQPVQQGSLVRLKIRLLFKLGIQRPGFRGFIQRHSGLLDILQQHMVGFQFLLAAQFPSSWVSLKLGREQGLGDQKGLQQLIALKTEDKTCRHDGFSSNTEYRIYYVLSIYICVMALKLTCNFIFT